MADIVLNVLVFLATAVLVLSFPRKDGQWYPERIKKAFNIKFGKMSEKEKINKRIKDGENYMTQLREHQKHNDEALQDLSKKIDTLVESDRDDIKAYITKEHHKFCYDRGWIDDFSLDCLEKRFKHYADEGGNSFICGFMQELRTLPKRPPQS